MVSTAAAVVAGAAAGRDRRRGERREATEQAAGIEAAATEEVAAKISEPSHVGGAVAPLPWLGGLLSACRRAKSVPPHLPFTPLPPPAVPGWLCTLRKGEF